MFDDCSLDFVYVDAVHDYHGVSETPYCDLQLDYGLTDPPFCTPALQALADMIDWWPKLAYGGVMAGHDYWDGIIGAQRGACIRIKHRDA